MCKNIKLNFNDSEMLYLQNSGKISNLVILFLQMILKILNIKKINNFKN